MSAGTTSTGPTAGMGSTAGIRSKTGTGSKSGTGSRPGIGPKTGVGPKTGIGSKTGIGTRTGIGSKTVTGHCDQLHDALARFRTSAHIIERWGELMAAVLTGGGRLFAAGTGGSAAQAQHLAAGLVGRHGDDRMPFSATALHADPVVVLAVAEDHGLDEVFARQVRAHGRADDILVLFSTGGAATKLLTAAEAAREVGVHVWALTGPTPNPLAKGSDEVLAVDAPTAAAVQELHLVAVHMMCEAFDGALERGWGRRRARVADGGDEMGDTGETGEPS